MTEKSGDVQSVSRALDLLTRLGSSDEGQRLSDLARATGLAVSTTHRLLTTMQQSGFVSFDPLRSEWHVGREAFAAGAAYVQRRDFVAPAMAFLRRLRDESRETANLGILEDGQLVTLAQVESREITRAISPPGGRVAATCSAMGKALLATWSDEQIALFCKRNGFRKLTPKSHRSLASLMADIRLIRKRGYAVDDEEHVAGLRCVAAVVAAEGSDAICAISVSGLANRLTSTRASVVAGRVVAAARDFAEKIGLG